PELRPYLEEVFDQAEPGQEFFVGHAGGRRANLRTRLVGIIRKAGETPWPKVFHNLRASRETGLAKEDPMHVVCAWIGNSAAVAAAHYLQVVEADYVQAATLTRPAESSAAALQNPVQHTAALICTERPEQPQLLPAGSVVPTGATSCDSVPTCPVPLKG